ncbi:MAG: helix-turn-helix domain-containing protein [Bacteroidetes bacterium]|nr:helix-turn-helix domain-containing protein [Bacteroidota bacterium]
MSVEFQLDSLVTLFFTAGAVLTSLFFGLHLLFRKQRTRSNIFLGALLILGSFTLLNSLFANAGIYSQFKHLYFIPLHYTLSFGPLTYFYVRTKIHPSFQIRKTHLLHAILPILQALFYFSIGFREYEFKNWMWQNVISVWYGDLESALFVLTFFAYIYAAIKLIKTEKQSSHPEWKSDQFRWLLRFLYLFLALITIQFGYDILDFILWNLYEINIYNITWASFLLDVSKVLAWYWVSFNGFQNAKPELLPSSRPKRKERYHLTDDNLKDQLKLLDAYVLENKPYLNPDFSLDVLAGDLNTTANKISFIINEGKQLNFNEYINELRVEEVKKRLLDPDCTNHTFLSIALDARFNSKATFYRVFKAHTGLTPKQFVEKQA